MYDYIEPWKVKIASVLDTILSEAGIEEKVSPAQVIAETPPKFKMNLLIKRTMKREQ